MVDVFNSLVIVIRSFTSCAMGVYIYWAVFAFSILDKKIKLETKSSLLSNEDVRNWLRNREQSFSENTSPISGFMLIWSYFEGRYLQTFADNKSITSLVNSSDFLVNTKCIDIDSYVNYFVERYTKQDGSYNHRFEYLCSDGYKLGDKAKQIINRYPKKDLQIETKFIGCLQIILRFRNNLFHGRKWQNAIAEQDENFSLSIKLLSEIMGVVSELDN